MTQAIQDSYLEWLGEQTSKRYHAVGERMGKHSPVEVIEDTDVFVHRGYRCEACNGYWAALEHKATTQPEDLPCLLTEGCEGPAIALYPTDEPVPDWIPVIIQGGPT